MTQLEITANLIVALSIFLAGRNSIHTWWTGILGCTLFGVLLYQAKLYADATLQVFFIFTSAIGWWQWSRGLDGKPQSIGRASKAALAKVAPVALSVAMVYGFLLHTFTDAYAPFVDSCVLVFSVIAQVLMMKRRLECWWFWLLVNTIAVPLYASRELYFTAGLYCCYWANALLAYRHWKRIYANEFAPTAE
jgi:nicotinamide mononucleotide transporter